MDDTYIIHEIMTEHGGLVHLLSLEKGRVQIKFLTADRKGIDYMICATSLSYRLESETVDEFIALIGKALERDKPEKKLIGRKNIMT